MLANRERAGLMPPEYVEQLIQAYDGLSALPPIGGIVEYKANLPALSWRWKAADRSILARASYPDLFTQLGHQYFLTGPTLTQLTADQGGNSPTVFATVNGRTYTGMQGGTQAGLYELGGITGAYARPGATGVSGYAGILNHPNNKVNQMAFANGYYAALRYSTTAGEQLFTSADGTTFAQYAGGISGAVQPIAIAGGGNRWVALSATAGTVYTNATANPASGWGNYLAGASGIPNGTPQDVFYDNTLNLFILVCTGGYIYTSPTGLANTWTQRLATTLAADSLEYIRRFGSFLYAWGRRVNNGGIFRSSDGVNWANVKPVGMPAFDRMFFDGARIFLTDATNNVVYVTEDNFATYYTMVASLFPFALGANVSPHGDPSGHVWIGSPSGFSTVGGMVAVYSYVTQFALPPSDAGKKQIVRVL